jgi:hypothetical protein
METLDKYFEVRDLAFREAQVILEDIQIQVGKLLGKNMGIICYRYWGGEMDFDEDQDLLVLRYTLTPESGKHFHCSAAWVEAFFESPPACYVTGVMDGPSSSALMKHMESATGRAIQKLKLRGHFPRVSLARFHLSEELDVELIAKEVASTVETVQKYLCDYDQRLRNGEISNNDLGYFHQEEMI